MVDGRCLVLGPNISKQQPNIYCYNGRSSERLGFYAEIDFIFGIVWFCHCVDLQKAFFYYILVPLKETYCFVF